MRVCIHGALGRMGLRLLALAHADPELTVTGAVDRPDHPLIGRPVGAAIGTHDLDVTVTPDLGAGITDADVVVSFALPDASLHCVEAAATAGIACVVGTTGFTSEQEAAIDQAARRIVLVQAPNFSLGVNMLFKVAEDVAAQLGAEFDIEIVEMHHNQKVDAPSGTAMRLAEGVARATGRELRSAATYGREGHVGARPAGEIGVMAVRGGDIVGEHTVIYAGTGERLELTHRAQNRDNFAKGALVAAKWTAGKSPGRYDMFDVLKLR